MTGDISTYYDGFRERLLRDFRDQNQRVVRALEFAEEMLGSSSSILDVGCGIGWSTSHMRAQGAQVTGLDISPALVETARGMFGGDFICADFSEWEPEGTFDAVLLIDAYEHFPREQRPQVHERIRQTQAQKVVLTVPTPQAQQTARDLGIPLQPIDEDVTDADIVRLAADIGGRVVVNEIVNIWEPGDYRHVLIETGGPVQLTWDDVSFVLVTRGDVDLEPILDTIPSVREVIVWDNSQRSWDAKCYGRYLAAEEATCPYIMWQDDDLIFRDHDALLAAWEPDKLVVNMPSPWYESMGYDRLGQALVGAGSLCPKGYWREPFDRYRRFFMQDEIFLNYCDFVFGRLVPHVRYDFDYEPFDYADAAGRIFNHPEARERRRIAYARIDFLKAVAS